jgi:hypothetical protein
VKLGVAGTYDILELPNWVMFSKVVLRITAFGQYEVPGRFEHTEPSLLRRVGDNILEL